MDSSQFQATMEAIHLRAMEERGGGGEEPAEAHCVRPALQRLSPGLHNVIRSPFQSLAAAACLRSGAAQAIVPHEQTLLQRVQMSCKSLFWGHSGRPLMGFRQKNTLLAHNQRTFRLEMQAMCDNM